MSEEMNVKSAVRAVLELSRNKDGLARGLREAVAALDRGSAVFCLLSAECDEAAYVALVKALCAQRKVPLIMVPTGKMLGEWAGLCKLDREGKARKVVRCSSVVVKTVGKQENAAVSYLNEQFKENKEIVIEEDPEPEAAEEEAAEDDE